jgi:outer membrane protein assembly factor BamD (BamD/ComL family)
MRSSKSTKIVAVVFLLAAANLLVFAQGPAKGKIDPERDSAMEIESKHNLEVARWSITKRKAYKGGIDRLQEIIDTYPAFSRMDEVLYWMGEANLKLNNNEKAGEYYSRLLKDFPESEFAKKSKEQLDKLKTNQ